MEPQTFQAREIQEALALVRRELGPDAVIVGTRQVPGRAFGLLGGSFIEVTAYAEEAQRPSAKKAAQNKANNRQAEAAETARAAREQPISTANRHKALLALNRARRNKQRPATTPSQRIAEEPGSALAAAAGAVPQHAALRRRLLASLIPRDLCETWLARLGPQPDRQAEERSLCALLAETLGQQAPLTKPGIRAAAFVGPTGVGKTTTIAKLAARAALVEQKKIALVSLDDQRIGGTAQLKAIASLLEVPIEICTSEGGLARVLASLRDVELVLIDTPGASPGNAGDFVNLRRRIERAGENVDVHLCVPAATRQEELDRILHLYGPLNPSALIATKLDEAVAIGSMFAARSTSDTPFSFVTTGQMIPEDIAPATPQLLIDVLLGGELP